MDGKFEREREKEREKQRTLTQADWRVYIDLLFNHVVIAYSVPYVFASLT